MSNLFVPPAVRARLGDVACDGLLTMFDDAHRLAARDVERHLDQNTTLLTERLDRRLAEQTAVLLEWSFLFWIGQVAAVAGMLALMLPRG